MPRRHEKCDAKLERALHNDFPIFSCAGLAPGIILAEEVAAAQVIGGRGEKQVSKEDTE